MLFNVIRALRRSRNRSAGEFDGAIMFVIDAADRVQILPDHSFAPSQASLRLRVFTPARVLSRQARVWAMPPGEFLALTRSGGLGQPRAIVIGKFSTAALKHDRETLLALLDWLARASRDGMPLFADFCDNYADVTQRTGASFFVEYQGTLGRHCRLIASTEALRAVLEPFAQRGIDVIDDPYESPTAQAIRVGDSNPLRLCWFGNLAPASAAPLERAVESIASRFAERSLELEIVASGGARELVAALAARYAQVHPRFAFRFLEWSLAAAAVALERCNFVLLPQDVQSEWGRVKSHNRLVEAIRAGRWAIASPIQAYQDLRDFAWVGDDLAEGLAWSLANPGVAAERLSQGQTYVAERFSPERVGHAWQRVLGLGSR